MNTSRTVSMRWALSMALAMCAHGALADDAAKSASAPKMSTPSAEEQSGLMSFPNVSLEHAPQAAAKPSSAQAGDAGMRVYIDPVTKQRRAQSLEEAQRQAAVSVKRPVTGRSGAQAVSGAQFVENYGPGNTVGIALGEESMQYQVVSVDANGRTSLQCVTGKDAAVKAMAQKPQAARQAEEVRHEH